MQSVPSSPNTVKSIVPLGSISSGTMLERDLIPCFCELLDGLTSLMDDGDDLRARATDLWEDIAGGDGACYGFWICEDVQELVKESDGLVVSDLSEVPDEFNGEVLHINDHGNRGGRAARRVSLRGL